jgi:hypothetical protein
MEKWSEQKKADYYDFIEQMIKDGYIKKRARTEFVKPTIEEIEAHIKSKEEATKFYFFYDSKKWMVGKNKMVNWKSSASGWMLRNQASKGGIQQSFNDTVYSERGSL